MKSRILNRPYAIKVNRNKTQISNDEDSLHVTNQNSITNLLPTKHTVKSDINTIPEVLKLKTHRSSRSSSLAKKRRFTVEESRLENKLISPLQLRGTDRKRVKFAFPLVQIVDITSYKSFNLSLSIEIEETKKRRCPICILY